MKTLYHGTSSKNVDSIKRLGLVPGHAAGADMWAKAHDRAIANFVESMERPPSVFVTDKPEIAEVFAHFSAEQIGGKPAVIKLEVPDSVFWTFDIDEAYSPLNLFIPEVWRAPKIDPAYITAS